MGIYSNNPEYWRGYRPSRRGTQKEGDVEVSGFTENLEAFGRIMTTDPMMERMFRKYIKNVLKEARNKLSKDAKRYMESDPRKAARAVKYSVYKTLFGGNISILQKGSGTAGAKYFLQRKRKVDENPKQRGGNRMLRDLERNRLDYYFGADRGYILRFISSGTVTRTSRFGNRGSIRQTDWFGHTAPWHMEEAATQVAQAINEYIERENG